MACPAASGIQRAAHALAAPIENLCVDHRGRYILVPKQLLHSTDIVAIFQQMRCKRVPERVAGGMLHYLRLPDRPFDRVLEIVLQDVVPANKPGSRIDRWPRRGPVGKLLTQLYPSLIMKAAELRGPAS